jgi:hypothetical protein
MQRRFQIPVLVAAVLIVPVVVVEQSTKDETLKAAAQSYVLAFFWPHQ